MKAGAGMIAVVLLGLVGVARAQAQTWSWQEPHARVLPKGDLEWAPKPFVFEAGQSVRYIDFEAGDDGNAGTKAAPWKHHPWDGDAAGKAKACEGIHTYVFKRGVIYRGHLLADDSGEPGNPIRLTSDPAWGDGEAALFGSVRLTAGWKRCTPGDAPKRLPEPEKVWYLDVGTDFVPRCLWELRGDDVVRVAIARHPNWTVTNPDDPQSNWFTWDGRERPGGWSVDADQLTHPDADYYVGGVVWSEYSGNMGTVHKRRIQEYDPARHRIRPIYRGNKGLRYFLEDLPQFLDSPGEYYYAAQGDDAGRLYLRLDGDRDPNKAVLELARRQFLVEIRDQSNIAVTGLRFSFLNVREHMGWPVVAHMPSAVRIAGHCQHIRVANCRFLHVPTAVTAFARLDEEFSAIYLRDFGHRGEADLLDDIVVTDNEIVDTDQGGIRLVDGKSIGRWMKPHIGDLRRVRILRNRLQRIGVRQGSYINSSIPAIGVAHGLQVEVAGNILDRCWGSGVFCYNAKGGDDLRDRPLIRILIHHNKVTNSLLATNDWGGIESWQGGPSYIYNNISGNTIGHKADVGGTWAFQFYLDGQFKSYTFNNIAWGKRNDPNDPYHNLGAFMQVIGFLNAWFNNTAYHTVIGSHRGGSQRSLYLGNLYMDMSETYFLHRHTPANDVPQQGYANNVFSGKPRQFGTFSAEGGRGGTIEQFRQRLSEQGAVASQTGWIAEEDPVQDSGAHDFRPTPGSAALDRGVKFFIPWGLYAVVGEWSFYKHPADPAVIVGENLFMTDEYVTRHEYYDVPRNDLTGRGVTLGSFVPGALEDWTEGALKFDGRTTHCVLADKDLKSDFHYSISIPEGKNRSEKGDFVYPGEKRRTVDMGTNNFLIEVYFRTEPGHTGGVMVSKAADAGYVLDLDDGGRARLTLRAGGKDICARAGAAPVNDGKWHHVIAEVNRASAQGITIYVDGKADGGALSGAMPGKDASLSNTADFLVGKGPDGDYFAGAVDFLRVSRGTLADADTTIEELYEWQFNGPFLRDFCGNEPAGKRDAGAIELIAPAGAR